MSPSPCLKNCLYFILISEGICKDFPCPSSTQFRFNAEDGHASAAGTVRMTNHQPIINSFFVIIDLAMLPAWREGALE
jgi:hypothetical protein